MPRSLHHRMASLALLLGLIAAALPAHAQGGQCFPATGFCISGEIAAFWEANGGLPIFGYPIGPEEDTVIEGQTYRVQRFERNRLELHPENPQPYRVLLGRLAAESLERQGRTWRDFPVARAGAPHFFAETQHAIAPEFWEYWSRYGLDLDGSGDVSFNESLALFGLPLSEATPEVNPTNGQTYLTQHFERARFELHPENNPPFNVLLGLMGSELGPPPAEDPPCAPNQPPTDRPGFNDPEMQDWPGGGVAFVSSGFYQNNRGEPFVITVTGRREDMVAAYTGQLLVCLAITDIGAAGPELIEQDRLVVAELLADQDTENLSIAIELDPDFVQQLDRTFSLLFVLDPSMSSGVTHHYPAKYRSGGASSTIKVSGGSVTGRLYKDCAAPATATINAASSATVARGGSGSFDLTVRGLGRTNSYTLIGTWSNIEASGRGAVTC